VRISGVKLPSLTAAARGAAIRFSVTFSGSCTAAAGLVVAKAQAKRLGLGRTDTVIASDTAQASAGTFSASVTVSARYRAKLKRARSVPAAKRITLRR
jgi:hypothetical protein